MHHDIYSRGFTESFGTAGGCCWRPLPPVPGRWLLRSRRLSAPARPGVVAFGLARRLFPDRPARSTRPDDRGALVRHSAPVALYSLLNIAIMQIDVVMLGMYVGRAPGVTLETLGIYAGAVAIAGGLRKVNQAFTPIFTPVVAEQMGRGQIREAEVTYGYLARWMLAILLPAVAVLGLSGDAIMSIFGPGFRRRRRVGGDCRRRLRPERVRRPWRTDPDGEAPGTEPGELVDRDCRDNCAEHGR